MVGDSSESGFKFVSPSRADNPDENGRVDWTSLQSGIFSDGPYEIQLKSPIRAFDTKLLQRQILYSQEQPT